MTERIEGSDRIEEGNKNSIPNIRLGINNSALGVIAMALLLAVSGCSKRQECENGYTNIKVFDCLMQEIPAVHSRVCDPKEVPKLLDEIVTKCPDIGHLDSNACIWDHPERRVREVATKILNEECRKVMKTKEEGGTAIVPIIIP